MEEIQTWTGDIHHGEARETLAEMPTSSVHMIMFSPPYYNARDYGVEGQVGLENSVGEYVEEMVDVMEEVRRVLRPDGVAWINLGDAFNSNRGDHYGGLREDTSREEQGYTQNNGPTDKQLKRKTKLFVPHRVAIALSEAGWVVRNDIVWDKPNHMAESVQDRFTVTFEFLFMAAPNPDYYFDLDAVKVPRKGQVDWDWDGESGYERGKNPGDVWTVNVEDFPDAHFAVYPSELVRKPIRASCPLHVCDSCGTPYEASESSSGHGRKQCECNTEETKPGIVLDPFVGSGTTCLVAQEHRRRFVGIELKKEYVAMAQKRLGLQVEYPDELFDADSATNW